MDIFCEIGLNSHRSVLTSLRSSVHTGTIFLFFEYISAIDFIFFFNHVFLSSEKKGKKEKKEKNIRKIRYLRTRLVSLNCILSHWDRGRSSRERGLQALPRLSLHGLFFGLFFLFCIFCYHSLLGVWSAVQLPAKASDGLSAYDFLFAAQLPATVSDGLSSSVFLFYLSGFFTCCSLTPRLADIYGIFLQRRDIYVIFASRQGTFCSLT